MTLAAERSVGAGSIRLWRGDITRLAVDVIVNAANSQLAGGRGVDGAIHRAAGPALLHELRTRYPQGCPTGAAVLTGAHALPARWVAHAVGPRWIGGDGGEDALLASAYRTALALAAANGCATVAAPSISTGVYGFPVGRAAPVALAAAAALAEPGTPLRTITFALFSAEDLAVYTAALTALPDPTA